MDLKISSNQANRPAEGVFPSRETADEAKVVYILLDSEFELLSVELSTLKGKLSNGQIFAPPVEVTCQLQE